MAVIQIFWPSVLSAKGNVSSQHSQPGHLALVISCLSLLSLSADKSDRPLGITDSRIICLWSSAKSHRCKKDFGGATVILALPPRPHCVSGGKYAYQFCMYQGALAK